MKKFILFSWLLVTFLIMRNEVYATVWISSTPPPSLYNYANSLALQEEFISGSTGTGAIGNLGWIFSGGTLSHISSETNAIGLIRRDTTAVINTMTRMGLNPSLNTVIFGSSNHRMTWRYRLNNVDVTTVVRFGVSDGFAGNPPANGIYLEKLAADSNWFCVTRSGGVQTRVDSTIPVSTTFITFEYSRSPSLVQFFIDHVSVCGDISSNIPSVLMVPGNHILNTDAVSKILDIDYFDIQIFDLVR